MNLPSQDRRTLNAVFVLGVVVGAALTVAIASRHLPTS